MLDDPNTYCPTGSQLKAWLFGGASIPTSTAIFDLAAYEGELVTDLFGEDSYFASAEAFWTAQNAAIEAKADAYSEAGWSDVVVLEPGSYFHTWEHERRSKSQGGKVFIAVSHRGDVTFHEGYVSHREARRERQAETEKPRRPELTAPLQTYIDLHRHAVVRARVAAKPMLALRLVLAHAILGSGLWNVRVEPQRAMTDAIAESVETCSSETTFDAQRRAVLATLGFDAEAPTVTHGYGGDYGISGLLIRLLALPDEAIFEALAIVMAETLEMGTALIETLGRHFQIDMTEAYTPDRALLDLIKDREVLDAMVAEVAGEEAAQANAKATGKVKRQIIADCLNGVNGRARVERFVPKWMTFPPGAYTTRGGVETVSRAAVVEGLFAPPAEPQAPTERHPETPSEIESEVAAEPMAEAA